MSATHVTPDEIHAAAAKYGIDPHLYERLIKQESGGQRHVGSKMGAQGPAQLMPGTARALGVDINDPQQNLNGGAKYLAEQIKTFGGDIRKAVAAYNAGPGAVQKYGGVPPYPETQHYVSVILGGYTGKGTGPRKNVRGVPTGTPGTRGTPGTLSTPGKDAQPFFDSQGRIDAALQFLDRGDPLALASSMQRVKANEKEQSVPAVPEIPGKPGTPATRGKAPKATAGLVALGGGAAGKGRISIFNSDPGRLKPSVLALAKKVSAIAGVSLRLNSGAGHSRLTATGGVSQHGTGNATDIPAAGAELTRLGRAALIACGMPRAQAMKQTGGLYNFPGGIQVIFHDRQQISGSPHDDHLHISHG